VWEAALQEVVAVEKEEEEEQEGCI
jgi:hypothetical protein